VIDFSLLLTTTTERARGATAIKYRAALVWTTVYSSWLRKPLIRTLDAVSFFDTIQKVAKSSGKYYLDLKTGRLP